MVTHACPSCEALNEPVGVLGWLAHFTCRHCGQWYSVQLRRRRAS